MAAGTDAGAVAFGASADLAVDFAAGAGLDAGLTDCPGAAGLATLGLDVAAAAVDLVDLTAAGALTGALAAFATGAFLAAFFAAGLVAVTAFLLALLTTLGAGLTGAAFFATAFLAAALAGCAAFLLAAACLGLVAAFAGCVAGFLAEAAFAGLAGVFFAAALPVAAAGADLEPAAFFAAEASFSMSFLTATCMNPCSLEAGKPAVIPCCACTGNLVRTTPFIHVPS